MKKKLPDKYSNGREIKIIIIMAIHTLKHSVEKGDYERRHCTVYIDIIYT